MCTKLWLDELTNKTQTVELSYDILQKLLLKQESIDRPVKLKNRPPRKDKSPITFYWRQSIHFHRKLEKANVVRIYSPAILSRTHCFHILHAAVVQEKLPKQLSFPVIFVILLLVWFDCAKISLSCKLPHMSHEYDLLIYMVSARQLYCLIKPSLLQNIYCWTYIHYIKPTGIAVLSAIFSLQLSRFVGCDIITIETYVICAIFCNLITIR